jgi:hypothetical protein
VRRETCEAERRRRSSERSDPHLKENGNAIGLANSFGASAPSGFSAGLMAENHAFAGQVAASETPCGDKGWADTPGLATIAAKTASPIVQQCSTW